MKKLMNDPDEFVDEMLDGLCAAHPELMRDANEPRVVRRAMSAGNNKVGITSGGGSGHLPLFTGYVGSGLLDTCAVGNVFAGPNLPSCMSAMRLADNGRGVLRLYGNYGGDRMNFDLAGEMLEEEGIHSTTVLGTDDIASASPEEINKRRGVAGIIYAYKAAGACADTGADLAEVTRMAEHAVSRSRTIGCALTPCQLPGTDQPTFTLGDNEIEMGMGIHGEPGIWRDALKPADAIADEMIERLLTEIPEGADGRVSVLVNSLGSTSLEELYIMYRRVQQKVQEAGHKIVQPLVGRYVTSMEMGGASISLLHLDDELTGFLKAPADCPFWKV